MACASVNDARAFCGHAAGAPMAPRAAADPDSMSDLLGAVVTARPRWSPCAGVPR